MPAGDKLRVAIIGCGGIGMKRARTMSGCQLVACADLVNERAVALARTVPGVDPLPDWESVLARRDVDIVVVCSTHNALAEITGAAVAAGKHVLVEKPAARRSAELDDVTRSAEKSGCLVRVGFNHRYHPALLKARQLVDQGALGELMYVRGRYGHGGRVGYEKEWRAQPALSGGGELIDQGIHLIDLARWFLGDFPHVQGFSTTYYWDMPTEDNGFMLLRTQNDRVAFLHASCTEWKNMFSFEVYGRIGKLDIQGLGGSYGTERIAYYRMLPEMGPPETTIWEYPMGDNSWEVEFREFLDDIRIGREPAASLSDAKAALQVVERIYEASGR